VVNALRGRPTTLLFGGGNVKTMSYWTVAARVQGLTPRGQRSVGEIQENMTKDRIVHPMAWMKRVSTSVS
jgi:hypothetical protein